MKLLGHVVKDSISRLEGRLWSPRNFPLDPPPSLVLALFGYGMRKLSSSYNGQCLKLRRDSDNAESDFGFVGGHLDTAAIATWLGAATGYVKTWYDQSGNGRDVTQATTANQPLYVASGQNSRPVIRFDGTNDALAYGSALITTNDLSLVIACKATAAGGVAMGLADASAEYVVDLGFEAVTGFADAIYQSTAQLLGAADLVDNPVVMVTRGKDNTGSYDLRVDAAVADTNPATAWDNVPGVSGISIGVDIFGGTRFFTGDAYEAYAYRVTITNEEVAIREQIADDYWSLY